MKNYKKHIIISSITLLIFILGFYFYKNREVSLNVPQKENYTNEIIKTEGLPKLEEKIKPPILKIEDNKGEISVILKVLDKEYKTKIKESGTAFEVMEKLKSEPDKFDFKYTTTRGMGSFITEINGIKGSPGKYWIYYVNEVKPSVGVSKYVMKDGDIIRWNQEGK